MSKMPPLPDPLLLLNRWSTAFAKGAVALPAGDQPALLEAVLGFQLGGQDACIDLAWLREILPVGTCTRIPQVQPWMRGIINTRGQLLPVVDGARFLGLAPGGVAKSQRILVVGNEAFAAGLIVDRVDGLRRFPHDAFMPCEQLSESPLKRFAAGGLIAPETGLLPLFAPALLLEDPQFCDAALHDAPRSLP